MKKLIQMGAGVALVAFGLLGSLALGGSLEYEPASAQAAGDGTSTGLEESVATMMQDHMGLDTEQAQEWARDMVPFMEDMHGEGAAEMVEYCSDAAGEGMMGGDFDHGGMMGSGMMGF